jgi:hypothetical protein
VIENNEPRFLRQVGFPERYLETLNALIPALKTRVNCDFEFETEDDCSDEESRLDDLAKLGWQLARLAPKIAEVAKDIARTASTKEQRVRELRDNLEQAAKEAGQKVPKSETLISTSSVEPVSIADLFRDL